MAGRNVNQKKIEKIEPRKKRVYTDLICLIASIIFFKIFLQLQVNVVHPHAVDICCLMKIFLTYC